jgi:cytochrome c peroxidase
MTRAIALAALALAGCPKHDKGHSEATTKHDAPAVVESHDAASLPELPEAPPPPELPLGLPAQNVTPLVANYIALGQLLFADPLLAADGKTTCATCHDPSHGFSGAGHQNTAAGQPNLRRGQPLVNLAMATAFGWDGRAPSLAEFLPTHFKGQLGDSIEDAAARLPSVPVYRAHLARATAPMNSIPTPDAVALGSLEMYVLSLYSGGSPWDVADHAGSVSPELREGHELFIGKAQCGGCHPPPLYTDNGFHRLGLIASHDEGRGRVDPQQTGAFATPTLRGAAARTSFFHDASATSLDAAIDWHLAGGTGQGADPSIVDPLIHKVTLSAAERAKLGAFVRALTPEVAH